MRIKQLWHKTECARETSGLVGPPERALQRKCRSPGPARPRSTADTANTAYNCLACQGRAEQSQAGRRCSLRRTTFGSPTNCGIMFQVGLSDGRTTRLSGAKIRFWAYIVRDLAKSSLLCSHNPSAQQPGSLRADSRLQVPTDNCQLARSLALANRPIEEDFHWLSATTYVSQLIRGQRSDGWHVWIAQASRLAHQIRPARDRIRYGARTQIDL